MIRKVIFIIAFSFTIGSYACNCGFPPDILEQIENTPLILTGRIISVQVLELETIGKINSFQIEITEVFKGTKVKNIEIRTGMGGADCGQNFVIGEEYLIWASDEYLSNKNDGIYGTSICNWNGLISEHMAGVEILRQMKSEKKL